MLAEDGNNEYQNIKNMMIDKYWGGYRFFTGIYARQTTINEFKMIYLEPGDILIYVDADDTGAVTGSQVMVYAGEGTLLSSNNDGTYSIYTGEEAESQLWKAFMKNTELFFALRPSQTK